MFSYGKWKVWYRMIRDFNKQDLELINTNDFSDLEIYKDYIDGLNLKTMTKNGEVVCIIGYFNYWGDNYKAFLSISEDFNSSKELKTYIYDLIEEYGMERVETESPDNETLNRWHEFLGFKREGTKVNFMDNQDYGIWSILGGQE
jgi:hypothetical protein